MASTTSGDDNEDNNSSTTDDRKLSPNLFELPSDEHSADSSVIIRSTEVDSGDDGSPISSADKPTPRRGSSTRKRKASTLGEEDVFHLLGTPIPTAALQNPEPLPKPLNLFAKPLPPSDQDDDGEEEDDPIEDPICTECGNSPCEWEEFSTQIHMYATRRFKRVWEDAKEEYAFLDMASDGVPVGRNIVRKGLYYRYTQLRYGHLGRGVRIHIPTCVEREIRDMYPERNESDYMGFRPA